MEISCRRTRRRKFCSSNDISAKKYWKSGILVFVTLKPSGIGFRWLVTRGHFPNTKDPSETCDIRIDLNRTVPQTTQTSPKDGAVNNTTLLSMMACVRVRSSHWYAAHWWCRNGLPTWAWNRRTCWRKCSSRRTNDPYSCEILCKSVSRSATACKTSSRRGGITFFLDDWDEDAREDVSSSTCLIDLIVYVRSGSSSKCLVSGYIY